MKKVQKGGEIIPQLTNSLPKKYIKQVVPTIKI